MACGQSHRSDESKYVTTSSQSKLFLFAKAVSDVPPVSGCLLLIWYLLSLLFRYHIPLVCMPGTFAQVPAGGSALSWQSLEWRWMSPQPPSATMHPATYWKRKKR